LDILRGSRESGKLTWYFTRYREIRAVARGRQQNYDNCMCPVTAVHWLTHEGNHLRPQQWTQAAEALQLEEAVALEIVMAADYEPFSNRMMRARLREATGLSDVLEEAVV
jgi:hypothetical protein